MLFCPLCDFLLVSFSQVMLEFSERSNRFPMVEHKSNDWVDLLQIRDSLLEEMEVDTDMLQDEFVR